MKKTTIGISFDKSNSNYFKNAIKMAQKIDGYKIVHDGKRETHIIHTQLDIDKDAQFKNIIDLINIISNWKSLQIQWNGKEIKPWKFKYKIIEIKNCFLRRKKVGEYYCFGVNAPGEEHKNFGCRYLGGINRNINFYRHYGNEEMPYWYEFGELNIEKQFYKVNKKEILRILKLSNKDAISNCCPFFSLDRIDKEVKNIPSIIDLKDSEVFEIKYSIIEKGKPISIKPKERNYSRGLEFKLSFGNNEVKESIEEKRNVPNVSFSQIGGQDYAIEQIKNTVQMPLLHPEYFNKIGIKPQSGILLYGPPGNGKTLLAKAVASESNAHLELINGPEILSKWVGQSEENLRKIFIRAKKFAPSVVLIDEIDCIAPKRDLMTQQHDIRLISQLLVLLDGMEERGTVSIIATTNRIEAVDDAILRPGRFDYHIKVPQPDIEGRKAILTAITKGIKIDKKTNLKELARITDGFSGADLANLLREAGLMAISNGISKGIPHENISITFNDFESALNAFEKKRVLEKKEKF